MPIDRLDFDNLTESDLDELLTGQVPEGPRLDYKRDPYGNTDAEKRGAALNRVEGVRLWP